MPGNNYISGLSLSTLEVFEQVSRLECINSLYLCGGTGQSLQMNHRLSEDLDFELLGLRKERPALDFGAILAEIKNVFPDAKDEILGEDHFLAFINGGNVVTEKCTSFSFKSVPPRYVAKVTKVCDFIISC